MRRPLAQLVAETMPEEGLTVFSHFGAQVFTTGDPTVDEIVTALGIMAAIGSPVLFLTLCQGARQ